MNVGAIADDIALIAKTSRVLQSLLDDLSSEPRLSGLEISAGLDGKSASPSHEDACGRCDKLEG